ncbi:hypothetical protein Trydic_g21868 [Trypoxylus dichotomus]
MGAVACWLSSSSNRTSEVKSLGYPTAEEGNELQKITRRGRTGVGRDSDELWDIVHTPCGLFHNGQPPTQPGGHVIPPGDTLASFPVTRNWTPALYMRTRSTCIRQIVPLFLKNRKETLRVVYRDYVNYTRPYR